MSNYLSIIVGLAIAVAIIGGIAMFVRGQCRAYDAACDADEACPDTRAVWGDGCGREGAP